MPGTVIGLFGMVVAVVLSVMVRSIGSMLDDLLFSAHGCWICSADDGFVCTSTVINECFHCYSWSSAMRSSADLSQVCKHLNALDELIS